MTVSRVGLGYKPLTAIVSHPDLSTGPAIQVPYRTALSMAVNCAGDMTIQYTGRQSHGTASYSPLSVASSGEGLSRRDMSPYAYGMMDVGSIAYIPYVCERTR